MNNSLDLLDISHCHQSIAGADFTDNMLSELKSSYQLSDNEFSTPTIAETELKLRAILDTVVHESLRQNSLRYNIPKLSEIDVTRANGLDLVLVQNKLVVFAPHIEEFRGIESFIGKLNWLMNESQGAKTWILDLSLVSSIPFELYGYLIGLKRSLNNLQIELELMWLKNEAVAPDLKDSIQTHFKLFSKGAFLLSR